MKLYTQLNIPNSRFISNKEKHLCNVIAHRNFKFFLSKNKKYALTQNYIALDYFSSTDSIIMSLLSSTLNNFAAISSSYKVIKPFNFLIKITNEDYQI